MNIARTVSASLVLCTGLVLGAVVLAGDLAPPPGPIGPTLKTLAKVEPGVAIGPGTTPGDGNSTFRIATPGFYYLTGNVTVVGVRAAIEIAASDVEIDLNGFLVDGSGSLFPAIHTDTAVTVSHITVRNGVLINAQQGIDLINVMDVRLEEVTCRHHASRGFAVGRRSELVDCTALENGGSGFEVDDNSVIRRCRAIDNVTRHGFSVGSRCRVTECLAIGNGIASPAKYAYAGIAIADSETDSLVSDCFVAGNESGIFCNGTGCTIVRNVAKGNALGNYSVVPGNHAGATVSNPALAGPWDNLSN